MRKFLLLTACLISLQAAAQEEKLRMTFKLDEISKVELNVDDIKEISFVEEENPLAVEGEWFDIEDGIFQSLSFSDDGTVNHYYYLTNYQLSGTESGLYWYQYNVFGIGLPTWDGWLYIPVVNYTDNKFTWRYNGQDLTYYKVQNVYEMETGDEPMTIGHDGDIITFTDNVYIGQENGKVKALKSGSGFVLVENAQQKTTYAYRINVKEPFTIVDWTQYFTKSKEEIVAKFGNIYGESSNTIRYTMDAESPYKYISFAFDDNGNVTDVYITLNEYESLQSYTDYFDANYVFIEPLSSSTKKIYWEKEKYSASSFSIMVDTYFSMYISYSYLNNTNN